MKRNGAKPVLPQKAGSHKVHARKTQAGHKSLSGLSRDGETAELLLYDDIGDFWGMGVSAESVIEQINGIGNAKILNVRINSPGGDVFDGAAIYNTLARVRIPVHVYIDGRAASIASIIAMAGDTITMASNGTFMIHKPWMFTEGDADGHRDNADLLDQVQAGMDNIYSVRTGQPVDVIKKLVNATTWMNAEKALELGFVDEITEPVRGLAMADVSAYDYKNIPEALKKPPVNRPDYHEKISALAARINKL